MAVARSHLTLSKAGLPLTVSPASDVAADAGLRGDDHAVADVCCGRRSGLSGEDDVAAHMGRSGEADLRAEQRVLTDGRAVADLDEVVDLGASADAGLADRGAVDGGVGLDLDVVLEDGGAGLEDLVPGRVPVSEGIWRAKPKPSAPMTAPFCRVTWSPSWQCSRTTAWAWAKKWLPILAWG